MNLFKIGDRVHVIRPTGLEAGEIKSRRAVDCMVTKLPVWVVATEYHNKILYCAENELINASIATSLPIGSGQLTLPPFTYEGFIDVDPGEAISDMMVTYVPECDCGGLTTYKTMAAEAHSNWCKSRNKS